MKFGKLTDLSAVDFSFPVEPLANAARLDRYRLGPDDGPSRIYVGPTGWSMKEWVGTWYPPKTKSADYLRHYGQQFNTIEFNTTHYRIPDAELVDRWCQSVPADFRFCPKLPQTVSHVGDFGRGSGDFQRFVGVLDGFGEKLGCVFGQLPPYFGAERLPQLEAFLDRWPRVLPLAIEVRHESWFADPFATEALMDALAARGVAAVITDVAGRRDVLHNYITAPRTMVRFVGNGLVPSDYERLADWAAKLRQWNLPEVYFFPHQPDNVLAPEATAHFVGLLKSQDIGSTRGPADLRDMGQISLF
ncbi:DUF72 domain-containing protein [Neolewinella lacunae]|uniref:DUF72 domain-containing protein n=1 Tax=Neolewinella lacunae TaxID=1517758 RepID=A0A923PJY4_9BACT|nr:DUF72 domain-containing protein [Neolewinella lacunae]MBC6994071.1 DUF72 domain-containing protein [Neolewinella lacunae]MDN3636058.1 DUF72 domain-containing protein [Neolewinella lacunae]